PSPSPDAIVVGPQLEAQARAARLATLAATGRRDRVGLNPRAPPKNLPYCRPSCEPKAPELVAAAHSTLGLTGARRRSALRLGSVRGWRPVLPRALPAGRRRRCRCHRGL